jgi:hypothetical protein
VEILGKGGVMGKIEGYQHHGYTVAVLSVGRTNY